MRFVSWVSLLTFSLATVLSTQVQASEGVSLDRTRIVIDGGKVEESLGVINHLKHPVLVQTSFLNASLENSSAFLASPPLYRLDAQRSNRVRVVKVESLPDDVESVFWVQVTFVPTTSIDVQQKVGLGYGQRIKLFYRPKNLQGDCQYVADHLQWNYKDGILSVKNPTKLSISMLRLEIDGKRVNADMVMPQSNFEWKLPNVKSQQFSFKYLDEYGGIRSKEVRF